VSDFVRALWDLSQKCQDDIFNIGAGEEYSIRTFADKICAIVGYSSEKIEYDTHRYVGATSKCLNVEKIKRVLPDYRLTPLDEGLRSTIEWFYSAGAYKIASDDGRRGDE
jgi:GDP-L-fucose synthase